MKIGRYIKILERLGADWQPGYVAVVGNLTGEDRVREHVLMTASQCRVLRTEEEQEADMWRHPRDIPDQNKLNLEAMISRVDLLLSSAMSSGSRLEIDLVQYKNE